MNYDITIILPCYNCGAYINKNIQKLETVTLKYFKKIEYIAIDDGSTDNTLSELEKIKKKIKDFKIIKIKNNSGKSNGVKKAIKISKGFKIVLYDSDLPYFKYLKKFFVNLKIFKLVIVNRRHKNSNMIIENKRIYNFIRIFIGNFISLINFHIFKIKTKDTQAGLKGFLNLPEFKKKKFVSKRFFLDIEILSFFKKKNIEPFDISVNFTLDKNKSSIKIFDFKTNIEIIREYIKVIKNI
jgi:glycosyltransferase involved in cell wall biosynthesis